MLEDSPASEPVGDVTRLLRQVADEAPGAVERLIDLVRDDLRSRASIQLEQLPPWRTLDPTGLVHEAYIKLFGSSNPSWQDRGHFFMAATRAMHDVLVDRARRATSKKRGGDHKRVPCPGDVAADRPGVDMLELDEAMSFLEARWPRRADIVRMRYYGGLGDAEIANALGISTATVRRDWAASKAWLLARLGHETEETL